MNGIKMATMLRDGNHANFSNNYQFVGETFIMTV